MTPVRNAIIVLSRFGIAGSAPLVLATPDALLTQAGAVTKEAQRRVERAQSAATPLDMLRAVFGDGFLALPLFTMADATELTSSLAASATLQGGDLLAVYPWFQQVQRVREPVSRLGASLQAAEVARTGATLRLAVAQLPHIDGERWVGLPSDPAIPMPAGKLSLVVHADAALNLAQPLAGILVDESPRRAKRLRSHSSTMRRISVRRRSCCSLCLPRLASRGPARVCIACCSIHSRRRRSVPSIRKRSTLQC
jgi:hypothetical protein